MGKTSLKLAAAAFLCTLALGAAEIAAGLQATLERISADSLRGHVSFLASDLLEGRDTPSRGLDIAAEYIAAQFRRAGLEPAGDDGFFQTAKFTVSTPNLDGFELTFEAGGQTIRIPRENVSVPAGAALELDRAGVVKVSFEEPESISRLTREQVEGKALLAEVPNLGSARQQRAVEALQRFEREVARLKPAVTITLWRGSAGHGPRRLRETPEPRTPALRLNHAGLRERFEAMATGPTGASVTLRMAAPEEERVVLRNVVGLLRGSDAALRDTCVLVSAHYDHIGARASGEGDRIFNGANDNASGTAALMEIAAALAKSAERPRRSVLFVAYFGEEKGMLGSRYYVRRPAMPVERTVANINLEQLGRTDDPGGSQVARASLTGHDYSDLGAVFRRAGEFTGVRLAEHDRNSDRYFSASDNITLAEMGVPAHTLVAAFTYPDYHGIGDHWDRLDYENMEKISRMAALAVVMVAENPVAPQWNESNERGRRYAEAAGRNAKNRIQEAEKGTDEPGNRGPGVSRQEGPHVRFEFLPK